MHHGSMYCDSLSKFLRGEAGNHPTPEYMLKVLQMAGVYLNLTGVPKDIIIVPRLRAYRTPSGKQEAGKDWVFNDNSILQPVDRHKCYNHTQKKGGWSTAMSVAYTRKARESEANLIRNALADLSEETQSFIAIVVEYLFPAEKVKAILDCIVSDIKYDIRTEPLRALALEEGPLGFLGKSIWPRLENHANFYGGAAITRFRSLKKIVDQCRTISHITIMLLCHNKSILEEQIKKGVYHMTSDSEMSGGDGEGHASN